MKRYFLLTVIILMAAAIFSSCYYDKEEELYLPPLNQQPGSTNCDTTNITYNATIKPVIDNHCAGCHSSGSFNFSNYSSLSAYLANNAQKLISNISYTSAQPMPPSGKLSECNILRIKIWIQAGYPNN